MRKFYDKFQLNANTKQMYRTKKEELINDFNEAVEKGSSPGYLKSLYNYTKKELMVVNSELNLLPHDGLSKLRYKG